MAVDRQDRDREILAVVRRLLGRRTYDELTVDEVAAEARASKATLYKRWGSKEEMVAAAIRQAAAVSLEAPEDRGSLRDDLYVFIGGVAADLSADRELVTELIRAQRRSPELFAAVRDGLKEPGLRVMGAIVARAAKRGEIADSVTTQMVHDLSMPILLDRAIWDEALDDDLVRYIVDELVIPLVTGKKLSIMY